MPLSDNNPLSLGKVEVYNFTSLDGHPLFQVPVICENEIWCVFESCTSPGSLTRTQPLFEPWESPNESKGYLKGLIREETQHLHKHQNSVRGLYNQGAFHARTLLTSLPDDHPLPEPCYLTPHQLSAYHRRTQGIADPWEGTFARQYIENYFSRYPKLREADYLKFNTPNFRRWRREYQWEPTRKEIDVLLSTLSAFTPHGLLSYDQSLKPVEVRFIRGWTYANKLTRGYLPPAHLYLALEPEQRDCFIDQITQELDT